MNNREIQLRDFLQIARFFANLTQQIHRFSKISHFFSKSDAFFCSRFSPLLHQSGKTILKQWGTQNKNVQDIINNLKSILSEANPVKFEHGYQQVVPLDPANFFFNKYVGFITLKYAVFGFKDLKMIKNANIIKSESQFFKLGLIPEFNSIVNRFFKDNMYLEQINRLIIEQELRACLVSDKVLRNSTVYNKKAIESEIFDFLELEEMLDGIKKQVAIRRSRWLSATQI